MNIKPLRPVRVSGDVAYVELTRGHFSIIDAIDVPLVEHHNWCAVQDGLTFYASSRTPRNGGRGKTLLLHRVIMSAKVGQKIDHRDGDGLNCRRSNLRLATSQQNNCNARTRRDNSTGLKGVSLHRLTGKWQASIRSKGKLHHLGLHDTPEAAHAAYCKASPDLHGEFGRAT